MEAQRIKLDQAKNKTVKELVGLSGVKGVVITASRNRAVRGT